MKKVRHFFQAQNQIIWIPKRICEVEKCELLKIVSVDGQTELYITRRINSAISTFVALSKI